jgi:hypothetical protein
MGNRTADALLQRLASIFQSKMMEGQMWDRDHWISHTRMSNPGRHADMIAALPDEAGALIEIIQGILVHSDWLPEYGLDEMKLHPVSRVTLHVTERLDDIPMRGGSPINVRRPAERRSIGTCATTR